MAIPRERNVQSRRFIMAYVFIKIITIIIIKYTHTHIYIYFKKMLIFMQPLALIYHS